MAGVAGACQCLAGWQGPACEASCGAGWWGAACSQPCRCAPHAACRPNDGYCRCPPGYTGHYCTQCTYSLTILLSFIMFLLLITISFSPITNLAIILFKYLKIIR